MEKLLKKLQSISDAKLVDASKLSAVYGGTSTSYDTSTSDDTSTSYDTSETRDSSTSND